jgi:hypothetical protein
MGGRAEMAAHLTGAAVATWIMDASRPAWKNCRKTALATAVSAAAVATYPLVETEAKQVSAAIRGVVVSGYDTSGVFGAPKSDLAGQDLFLPLVIDSTKGKSDNTGIITTGLKTDGTSNPVTGALVIKGKPADLGSLGIWPIYSTFSQVDRYMSGTPKQYFNINISHDVAKTQTSGNAGLQVTVQLPKLPTAEFDWSAPLYYKFAPTGPADGSFGILRGLTKDWPEESAWGTFHVTSISISPGIYSADDKAIFAARGLQWNQRSFSTGYAWLVAAFSSGGWGNVVKEGIILVFEKFLESTLLRTPPESFPTGLTLSQTTIDGLEKAMRDAGAKLRDKKDVAAATLLALAIHDYKLALDPPDFDYKAVAPRAALSLPATGEPILDQVIVDALNVMSLEGAVLNALEKWEGASIDGDDTSAALQLNAFNTYAPQADNARRVLAHDLPALADTLEPTDINSVPGGAAALAAAINGLCGQPLPFDLNAELLSLGLSQSAINQGMCNEAKSVLARDINTNFGPLLLAPTP